MRSALKLTAGSLVVYLVMAACSAERGAAPTVMGSSGASAGDVSSSSGASGSGGLAAGSSGSAGMMGTGGASGGEATGGSSPTDAGLMDALADAMSDALDPVPDADAQPVEPETAEADCDKTVTSGALTYRYAEFSFPGRTQDELALAGALLHQVTQFPPSYSWTKAANIYITTGKIAVMCELTAEGAAATIDFARVVVP